MKRFSIYQYLLIGLVVLGGLAINTKISFAADRCHSGTYGVYGKNVDRAFWFDAIDRLDQTNYTEYPISDYAFVMEALQIWQSFEDTKACWNPLATGWDTADGYQTNFNEDVHDYTRRFSGIKATTATLSMYNTANPNMKYIREMFARQNFYETGIKWALMAHSNHDEGYVDNLTKELRYLYYNWSYTTITSQFNGKVIDISGWSRDNGATVHQWDWHGGNNQQWHLKNEGNGYYSIISLNSGKCLDVSGWSTSNGGIVHQWDCHGGSNQHWKLKQDWWSGDYSIISRYSEKCNEMKDWSRYNGGQIQQWSCTGNSNQLWSLRIP